ncbi:MAG: hypothetical protein JXA94_03740 [Parachlamydiales bacterium]|nr:hypothetical protein [Parachlamydiales bacterium]
MSLITAASQYRDSIAGYLESRSGKEQFRLRYELRDLYVELFPLPSEQDTQLIQMGADLKIRVSKWVKKIETGDLQKKQTPATIEELFAKAQEYIAHYNSNEHIRVLKESESKEKIIPFQQAILEELQTGNTEREICKTLKESGFSDENEANERVFGRVKNWAKQFNAGNLDYFDIR